MMTDSYPCSKQSSRDHGHLFYGLITQRLPRLPHRTGLEELPHPALQKHILNDRNGISLAGVTGCTVEIFEIVPSYNFSSGSDG